VNPQREVEMSSRPLSVRTSKEAWLRRVWNSMWLVAIGRFASQVSVAGQQVMNPSLLLELERVNGQLVLMGRNQAMKMLIRASQVESRQ
jgi:hypothetical protein